MILTFLMLETATTEVDDLDRTLGRVTKKHVLYAKSATEITFHVSELRTSGLRSQWINLASFRTLKASKSCAVKTFTN